jgi:hypothetical protein
MSAADLCLCKDPNLVYAPHHYLKPGQTHDQVSQLSAQLGALHKKQSITALSSMEAKYIALSEVAREAQWLRSLFKELGFEQTLPTTILGDNEGSIAITKNPQFHKRAKHIDLQSHLIREQVREGEIIVESCRSHSQTADMLTKPLPRVKHKQHTAEMGLASA